MKTYLFSLLLAVLGCVGCSAPSIPAGQIRQDGVSAYLGLDLHTTYTVGLSENRVLIMESSLSPRWHDFLDSSIFNSYELKQADGNSISFDCAKIAEKIIDAAVVAEIRPYCESLPVQATQFWKSLNYDPDDFYDERGNHWRRVKEQP